VYIKYLISNCGKKKEKERERHVSIERIVFRILVKRIYLQRYIVYSQTKEKKKSICMKCIGVIVLRVTSSHKIIVRLLTTIILFLKTMNEVPKGGLVKVLVIRRVIGMWVRLGHLFWVKSQIKCVLF